MNPDIQKLLILVHTHYSRRHNVAFYAAELGMHPRRLNKICRAELGITAKKIIIGKIMERAKALLATQQAADVARVLGFTGTSYFYRFFKRYAGVSVRSFTRIPPRSQRNT
ncbi:MAG: helix-turn-helix transcriptional regulator [Spirochaetales bacterium]|jgi:AraC family transcriptional regulator, transcriptional activator of pobA|nr:helix-turn-helix transcriptional regulator [Spirochaetales bacterium]